MKSLYYIVIIILSFLFLVNCGKNKSHTVVVVHSGNVLFAEGEPRVKYYSSGARLDYFIPGAIIILKTNYKALNQELKLGKVYQISKDNILNEIGSIDTTLNDTTLVNNYLINKIRPN